MRECHDGETSYFKCVKEGEIMREFPQNKQGGRNSGNKAQSSSVAPQYRPSPRGATSGIGGGANPFYAITSHQEQKNYIDIVMGMIKVFTFDDYAFLDLGLSLSFVNPYVANQF